MSRLIFNHKEHEGHEGDESKFLVVHLASFASKAFFSIYSGSFCSPWIVK